MTNESTIDKLIEMRLTAMADAFRNGNLGIMDYYRMKNIQADTSMRDSMAHPDNAHPAGHEPISK